MKNKKPVKKSNGVRVTKAQDGWVRVETPSGPVLVRDVPDAQLSRQGVGRKGTIEQVGPQWTQESYFNWMERYLADPKTMAAFMKEIASNE